MEQTIRKVYKKHQDFWTKEKTRSLIRGVLLFILALFIEKYADNYVGRINGLSVQDLFLSNLPTIDVDSIIIFVPLVMTGVIILLLIFQPKYINFTLKAMAVFVIIRSFFITLTHLGVSPQELQLDTSGIGFGLYNILFNTKGDFFFSGHTGIPFLMALIFWQEKYWRYLFLIITALLGVSVLFAHIHYSIDVFAAPFMVYSIYAISKFLFKKDFDAI